MDSYVRLKDIPQYFGLKRGDSVWISSDVKELLYNCIKHEDDTDLNVLLDSVIDIIGPEGTILVPTFNWDFCKGKTFDIRKSPSQTGSIGKIALKREDFKRTRHPIYSFAVWGAGADELVAMDNRSSFGNDGPFRWCRDHDTKNVFIDVECQHSYTFVHYVEEVVGVPYRYLKNFTAGYIDENGEESVRTYSMHVRDLKADIYVTIYPYEEDFIKARASRRYEVNGIPMKTVSIGKTYGIILDDVRYHNSSKLCTYSYK